MQSWVLQIKWKVFYIGFNKRKIISNSPPAQNHSHRKVCFKILKSLVKTYRQNSFYYGLTILVSVNL